VNSFNIDQYNRYNEKLLEITKTETIEFINKFDDLYDRGLSSFYYYPSVVRVSWINKWLKLNKNDFYFPDICVTGGDKNEMELKILKFNNVFELNNDLNKDFDLNNKIKIDKKFDLVLSNQVMEHVYDLSNYFWNLKNLTKKNGYVFLSVPHNNNFHEEANYGCYTSGYHITFLNYLAKKFDFEVINYGEFGSAKCMIYTMLGHWLNYNQLKRGIKTRLDIFSPLLCLTDGLNQNCKVSKFFFKRNFITDYWILLKNI